MPLLHPFDDPVFAAVATARGYARTDLPEDYEPDVMFQNADHVEDLPGMPPFHFICGDDQYDGDIRVQIAPGVTYHWLAGSPYVNIDRTLPVTLEAALPGQPIDVVVELPGASGSIISGLASQPGHTSIQLHPYA